MAPNILLVVLDAVRRDTVEPYGAPTGSTPTIAGLARSGSWLPMAYATASWTLPSHASMFTGLLPRQLGLGQAPEGSPQSARPALENVSDRVLAEVLRRAGYATASFSTNLWVSQHSGFDIGVDRFSYSGDHRQLSRGRLLGRRPDARLSWALDGLRASADDGAAQVRDDLTHSIGAWSGQPTFWFVNLCECHSPYLPPRPWNDLPPAERVRAALEAHRHESFEAICLYAAGRWEIPAETFDRMRHLYGRAASYMDRWLADVLQALEHRGILEDTLVIVTSDHGENFGEDGLVAHGFSVDQRLIHVPLVMAGPGTVSVSQPFSLAELPRVVADAAGLRDHPWQRPELPEGVAIAQYDPMGTADHPRVREFATRWQLDDAALERLTAAYTCATDGQWKLVVRNGVELAYDLSADPDEEHPLDPTAANGRLDRLRTALEHPSVRQVSSVPAPSADTTASPDELAAIERQMKLLGYM